MKALKSHKKSLIKPGGFTLFEVVIAMTIAGFSLMPLFLSQGRLLQQTGRNFAAWEGMIELKNFMYTTTQKQTVSDDEKEQKKITTDSKGVTLSYDLFKPSESSSLKDILYIRLIKAQAEWDFFGPDGVMFASALSVAPKPKQKDGDVPQQNTTQSNTNKQQKGQQK